MNRREVIAGLVALPVAAALPATTEIPEPPPERAGQFLVTDMLMEGVAKSWQAAQPVESVSVHCRGGAAFEGLWLANAVKKEGIPVHVAGLAAGIAALLPIYAARSSMHPSGFVNLMNCWATAVGPAEKQVALRVYLDKIDASIASGIAEACTRRGHATQGSKVLEWMSENHWFSATDALEAGLITEISER